MPYRPQMVTITGRDLRPWDVIAEGRVLGSIRTSEGQGHVDTNVATPVIGSPTAREDGRLRDYFNGINREQRQFALDEPVRVLRACWMWFQPSECEYPEGGVWLGDYALHLPSEPGSVQCICGHGPEPHVRRDEHGWPNGYAPCSIECGCIDYRPRDWAHDYPKTA